MFEEKLFVFAMYRHIFTLSFKFSIYDYPISLYVAKAQPITVYLDYLEDHFEVGIVV